MSNYFDETAAHLGELIPGNDPALLRYYALLVLTTGENTPREHVHDAWSAWRTVTRPDHPSLAPFDELTEQVKAYDDPYVDAIRQVAAERALVTADSRQP